MVGFETTKSALAVSADFVVHDIASKGNQTAVGEPLHRSIIVPPPIPVGGASYAVTHSQRKYHNPHNVHCGP